MGLSKTIWAHPPEYLRMMAPENPVLFFAPSVLQATARLFVAAFPGLVTYAVKANPAPAVIENLAAAGIRGFDVASPDEIRMIARHAPEAAMHYNNPVRSRAEIAVGVAHGVASWSVDSHSELDKLVALVPAAGTEIAVRFKLPVEGAAYDFGAKFGAAVPLATALLARVAAAGFTPALTFHPGTQCTEAAAWLAYITAAAGIARDAGVRVARLNVGGGFPAHRKAGVAPQVAPILAVIGHATAEAFGGDAPALVCEPGRAMVAEAFTLAATVKAVRDGGPVFLNDGVYGALAELPLIGGIDRITVLGPAGPRRGAPVDRLVFGPTCDSVDRLPGMLALPGDIAEGDHVLFAGLGAYSTVTNTRFNGFGDLAIETVMRLAD